jgi:hypothetical protein
MGGLDEVFGSDKEDGSIDGALAPAAARSRVSLNASYPVVADGYSIFG